LLIDAFPGALYLLFHSRGHANDVTRLMHLEKGLRRSCFAGCCDCTDHCLGRVCREACPECMHTLLNLCPGAIGRRHPLSIRRPAPRIVASDGNLDSLVLRNWQSATRMEYFDLRARLFQSLH
jgi:hypothetical protein